MVAPIDLIINFQIPGSKLTSKDETRKTAVQAEQQYTKLLSTLTQAGLRAVGKGGEKSGKIMICVECPPEIMAALIRRERHSDFIHGLPTVPLTALSNIVGSSDLDALSPSARTRIIYSYVSSTQADGGLGVSSESPQWSMIESITTLHDRKFNESWLVSWSTHLFGGMSLDTIREQFGDSVALYFSYLSTYTLSLILPSIVGALFWLIGDPFSPVYSIILLVYSTTFVEYWRIKEHLISLKWGTANAKAVELRRHVYTPGEPWWLTELRYSASTPIILLFAMIVTAVITGIFLIEAFASHLYTGPGHQHISLAPTILFTALIPTILSTYQTYAVKFTKWENHAHQSSYDASLTRKTFALSAIVAYLGLALSAFVYMPFGGDVMHFVQSLIAKAPDTVQDSMTNITDIGTGVGRIWFTDSTSNIPKLDPSRLQNQMYAYTVTNQGINMFLEIGLPYITRLIPKLVARVKGEAKAAISKKQHARGNSDGVKRVVFEGEEGEGSKEEREFLEKIRSEVAKPEFLLFTEYSEMVTQFGYVTLWSSIWPLAPFCALVNNIIELRSDAIKLTQHVRRPIPERVDTIGPWLDCLTLITWLGALSNAALVYIFRPAAASAGRATALDTAGMTRTQLLSHAVLVALCASHGYIILRTAIRHVLNRVLGSGRSTDSAKKAELEIKEAYLQNFSDDGGKITEGSTLSEENSFWTNDLGLDEVRRAVKDA